MSTGRVLDTAGFTLTAARLRDTGRAAPVHVEHLLRPRLLRSRAGDGIPTLMRSQFDLAGGVLEHQPAVPMIEGIEGFRVELGIDDLSETGRRRRLHGGRRLGRSGHAHHADQPRRRRARRRIRATARPPRPAPSDELMNVTAVKLYVLARSREPSQGHTDTKTYALGEHDARAVQRRVPAPRLRDHGAPAEHRRPEDHAVSPSQPHAQRGAALVVGMIMLVLITLMLITALNLGTTNFRAVTNMQFRRKRSRPPTRRSSRSSARLSRRRRRRKRSTSTSTTTPTHDYVVQIAVPECISAAQAFGADPSSLSLPPTMTAASTWNTVWDLDATVDRRRQRRRRRRTRARGRARAARPKPRRTRCAHDTRNSSGALP